MTFTQKAQELMLGCSEGCNFPIKGESGIVYCYVCSTKISQMREDLLEFKNESHHEDLCIECNNLDFDISNAIKVLDGGAK